MSDFQWTDKLVDELVYEIAGNIGYDKLQAFKASKQPKQEWEIVERGGPEVRVGNFNKYEKWPIYRVRRLSDGEVFTVGDVVEMDGAKEHHAIVAFEVSNHRMLAKFSCFPKYEISTITHLNHAPIPVWLTPSQIKKLKKLL